MISKLLGLLLLVSCAHSASDETQKKKGKQACVQSYLSFSENKAFFVGLGEGYSIEMAKSGAEGDLIKSISTTISTTTSLSESDVDVAMTSMTSSESSGQIDGLSYREICDDGQKSYAVAVLSKSDYFKSVKSKIKEMNKDIDSLIFDFDKSSGGEKLRLASEMRTLSLKIGSDYEGLVAICKSFRKCPSKEGENYKKMQRKYKKILSSVVYELETSGDVGVQLSAKVKSILVKSGLNISNKASAAKADLSCVRKDFSKTEKVSDLVVSISCEVKLHSASVSIYNIQIEATGLGRTSDKAYSQASNNLEIVSSK